MKGLEFLSWATGLALCLAMAPAAQAHDDAYLDTVAAPHGGQLRMTGPFHYELVLVKDSKTARNNAITVYVTLLSGKTKVSGALKPDGDNRLTGRARYASTPAVKAIVSITMAGQAPLQARFTPLAPRSSLHGDHP